MSTTQERFHLFSMSSSYTVSEYMHPHVPTVAPGTTLRDLVRRMLRAHEHWVVVADEQGKIHGGISSLDIVRYLVPDYMEKDVHLVHFAAKHNFRDRVEACAGDPVEKFMTSYVKTIRKSESLMSAAAMMVDFRIHRLPVVDEKGALVGYIGQTAMANAIIDVFFTQA